ncbi:MAG: PilZ domain-containing protein [Deltaproteobacteria bacterium]|nr:PilZ domain-containing protein [Deltaproteobacteria bacterium]
MSVPRTRFPNGVEVRVSALGRNILSRETKNISMSGMFLVAAENFPTGTGCQLTILLGDPGSQERIDINGKVVRVTQEGMAFHFEEILGAESYNHLRNLVLYNAPDAERLLREIGGSRSIKVRP